MKKLAALLLGSAMFVTAIAGLVACGGEGDGPGNGGPTPGGPTPENPTITRRVDPRATDAYEAYDHTGNKIGAYKTIADAINAAVESDVEYFDDEAIEAATVGGYVTKKGSDYKLFQNKKGFADGNSDQFWYYQNGTELTGYNCWDATFAPLLQNQKIISHEIASMGVTSTQGYNGYGLLNYKGQELKSDDTPPINSWQLSKPMDAGVIAFPDRRSGVSGLKYKLDLSEVKITPAYEGVEESIYAFLGFYAWQDYYVVAVGIACDTTTGNWYGFQGTSRDDSFSDAEYNLGDCVMTSTWNAEGGYFTPNVKELEMEIKTTPVYDEEYDESYYVDEMKMTMDGKVGYERTVDDELVGALFPGYGVDPNNGFVFIAGLDIKNDLASGGLVKNVDYFNGATFENLVVVEAGIYYPTVEEIPDEFTVSGSIAEGLRGKYHDAIMANDEYTEGTVEFTILNNYVCTSYEAKDGCDYYSFKFDGSPVSENLLGGKLKEYQDKIDSLKDMTKDNIDDYRTVYDEVALWYGTDKNHTGSSLSQTYWLLLDFTNYEKAKEVFDQSLELSDEARALITRLEGFEKLTTYPYLGFEAPEDAEAIGGYLWTEAQAFGEIYEAYQKLSETDQLNFFRVYTGGEDEFMNWVDAYTTISDYLGNEAYLAKTYTIGDPEMKGQDVTYTGKQALVTLFDYAYKIKTTTYDGASEKGVMNSDNTGNFMDSFHLLFLMKKMEEAEVEIPTFFTDFLIGQITSTSRSAAFKNDFDGYIYPVLTLAADIYNRQQEGEFVWLDAEMAEIINGAMINFSFTEGGFKWNVEDPRSGPAYDLRNGNTNYEHYFGLPNGGNMLASLQYIIDVVQMCDSKAELTDSKIAFKAEVTPLTEDPSTHGSDEAKAIVARIEALTDLATYEYKGWTTDSDEITGYLYSEVLAFRQLAEDRAALPAIDGAYVSANTSKENYNAWQNLSVQLEKLTDLTVEAFSLPMTSQDMKTWTGVEIFGETMKWATMIATTGSNFENDGKAENDGAADGVMKFDSSAYPSIHVCRLVEAMKTVEGFVMPDVLNALLTKIGYESFYEEAYYPIFYTVQLAERIATEELTKMGELEDEELDFLNEVWVNGYTLGSHIAWNWNQGTKFEMYYGSRTARICALAGGTLTNNGTPYKTFEYFAVVAQFLTDHHYTVKDNGWGVTADKIEGSDYSEDLLAFIENWANLGDLNAYKYLGWTAPDGTAIKGYLYSEAKFFEEQIKPAYEALTEDDQEEALAFTNGGYDKWLSLAETVKALNEDSTFMNDLTIHAVEANMQTPADYSGPKALGELIAVVGKLGTTPISSDGCFNDSVRMMYLKNRLEENDVELPEYLLAAYEELTTGDENAIQFTGDLLYLDAVLMLAQKISALEPGAKLELTEDVLGYIELLVGRSKFEESGMNWNFTTDERWGPDPAYSDLTARDKTYKLYYGLTADAEHYLSYYLDLVMNHLVENFGATATEHNMGITEAITVE